MSELERIKFEAEHTSLTSNPPIHKVTVRIQDFNWLTNRVEDLERTHDQAMKVIDKSDAMTRKDFCLPVKKTIVFANYYQPSQTQN